eukprot:8879024-Pyramimonas_sp.AAC.1
MRSRAAPGATERRMPTQGGRKFRESRVPPCPRPSVRGNAVQAGPGHPVARAPPLDEVTTAWP